MSLLVGDPRALLRLTTFSSKFTRSKQVQLVRSPTDSTKAGMRFKHAIRTNCPNAGCLCEKPARDELNVAAATNTPSTVEIRLHEEWYGREERYVARRGLPAGELLRQNIYLPVRTRIPTTVFVSASSQTSQPIDCAVTAREDYRPGHSRHLVDRM
ncbi:hypothetical protein J7T55_002783 [Diaporthe amygdali]|uniref:uncharacterized protein n=1 Tax=Phomopsis amygdali TaxID=1214568 RepID=UPI0022FE3CF6|nr:uncharacterized protein J7T55_002783 [Diaporthe amygdali]KAJ0122271.1 hypothetical protein J7T55_002783 [Diaporthe amygdali]